MLIKTADKQTASKRMKEGPSYVKPKNIAKQSEVQFIHIVPNTTATKATRQRNSSALALECCHFEQQNG